MSVQNIEENMMLFQKMETVRKEILEYLPKDFDSERELEEAKAERYGNDGLYDL